MTRPLTTRREFLTAAAAAAGALSLGKTVILPARQAPGGSPETVAFFHISDLHYFADPKDPTVIAPRSAEITSCFVETLNRLGGTEIPEAAGGGRVLEPRGVIATGDLIDTGDKGGTSEFLRRQKAEWQAFVADFGLNSKGGRLRLPVHEIHGNHDSPPGTGPVVEGIIERNRRRSGLSALSPNGLHTSWDWGPVHFLALGIVVGEGDGVTPRRRYNPLKSLEFLKADLGARVGSSGRPVVIAHHLDVIRYSRDPASEAKAEEWDPADARKYFKALRGYNVIAILYGHTHARNILQWDGTTVPAAQGIQLFNADNASHYADDKGAFFYFEIGPDRMTVREYATADRWKTGAWTPQAWTFPLRPRRREWL